MRLRPARIPSSSMMAERRPKIDPEVVVSAVGERIAEKWSLERSRWRRGHHIARCALSKSRVRRRDAATATEATRPERGRVRQQPDAARRDRSMV